MFRISWLNLLLFLQSMQKDQRNAIHIINLEPTKRIIRSSNHNISCSRNVIRSKKKNCQKWKYLLISLVFFATRNNVRKNYRKVSWSVMPTFVLDNIKKCIIHIIYIFIIVYTKSFDIKMSIYCFRLSSNINKSCVIVFSTYM